MQDDNQINKKGWHNILRRRRRESRHYLGYHGHCLPMTTDVREKRLESYHDKNVKRFRPFLGIKKLFSGIFQKRGGI